MYLCTFFSCLVFPSIIRAAVELWIVQCHLCLPACLDQWLHGQEQHELAQVQTKLVVQIPGFSKGADTKMVGEWTVSGMTQCEGQVWKARYRDKWKIGNVGVQISLYRYHYVFYLQLYEV